MALVHRTRNELDWPEWPFRGRLFELPDRWTELLEGGELKVEEFEEGDSMVVRVEAPGIDPAQDVELTISDHTLHIRVERRQERTAEDAKGYRSEFRYGSFTRMIDLPVGTTADDVTAEYADGVLEVRLPREPAAVEARRIPVTRRTSDDQA
ncbi:Hsp20/alpha crystallin family protein [Actinomarinicola tropica]|uniref:Hsp20 family protein n=1 Tax=Actinomarinicola tropica TaxID=2789776 RepID=A0A5Q2REX5_9ACTN|nr:Hsp20/alpha crystallin family protein [Actinomarinicola tropica]QGG95408.1 Hsp20 family protein [Actinomarinicola tropica]